MPLFTWCEIQGLFYDFPGPFQGNPGPSLSTKQESFTEEKKIAKNFGLKANIQWYRVFFTQIQKPNT